MQTQGKRQKAKGKMKNSYTRHAVRATRHATAERGFSLTELMISLMVFTVIMGSVFVLVNKSQRIFSTEQQAAETNQNSRLLMDFLTRDIQQSKENALGLGSRFRSIYSHNGPEGKTDELTIVSSDTDTQLPSSALPLIPASMRAFNVGEKFVEIIPNSAGNLDSREIVGNFQPNENFIVSTTMPDGAIQFDFIQIKSATLTNDGAIGISFDLVEHRGIEPEIAFGGTYENGAFTMRPVAIKRYYVDRKTDPEHPSLALTINDSQPITIARNVHAFQLRYLQVREGDINGEWVKQQEISSKYRTEAVEITMTAQNEVATDSKQSLVTLASVVRPRNVPTGTFGTSGSTSSGVPGENPNGGNDGFPGDGSGTGGGDGFPGGSGRGGNGRGNGGSLGGGGNGDAFGRGGYNHETRRIGKQPKLGERLNPWQERNR